MIMAGLEYNIDDLFQEARKRWLKPVEVLCILRNYDMCELTHQPPHQPAGNVRLVFVEICERNEAHFLCLSFVI